MPGVIPYKVSLDIDNQQALKKLLDVNTKMTQLENGQILIDFKYNKNIKDFNKKAAEISKLSPDLGVQFQYDVNKRGLLQAKEQLTQLTDLQVGVDTLGAKEYIKQLTKEVKDLFDDAASEQQLAAPIQKLLNTVITLDKDLLPSIQVELGDIYEEFEELSKLKPISLMNMGDIDDLEHDIKGFESALEKLKKQGAIDVADKADNKEIAELTERVSILEDRVLSLQHGLLSLSGEGFINASDSADVLLSKLVEIAKTLEIIPQKTYDVSKAVVHNGNISVIGKKERVRSDNMGRLPELLMNGMGHGSDFFFSTPPAADVASDTFGGLTNGFKGLKTYIIDLSKLKDELHQLQFEEQAAEDEAIEALKSINAFAFKESAGIDKLKELGIETKDTSRYGYEIPDTIEDLYNIVKDKIPDMSLTLKEFNNLLQEEIQKLNSMGEITKKGFYENQEKFGNEILPSDKFLEKLGYTGFTPISDGPNDGSGIGGWIINVEKYLHNTEDSIEYIKSFTEKQADEAEDYIANIDQHFAELNNRLKEKFKEYIVQIIQLAKTLGENIANGLADGIDAHSDSKKAIKSGEDFVNGVTHSIEDNTDEAVSAAKQLGEKVSDALDESLNNINDDTVSLSISSPTQVFDNEIQQNLVMLENYKNTIAEIDRLKLEPETDEIKHKIEELNKLADYFASKITTIQSENGHEVNRSMMQFSGNWNENLRSHYTEEQRKAFWKIAGERSGLNRHTVATEFSGITEELERIEEKSNKLASVYAKDITESRNYVSRLRADLLNLVETQEELAVTSPKSKDYALYTKDIDVFSKRSPELLQFLDRLKTYEQATDFVKTDEWLDFLATLPKAHDYLESIGYDFNKIQSEEDISTSIIVKENTALEKQLSLEEQIAERVKALRDYRDQGNDPSKLPGGVLNSMGDGTLSTMQKINDIVYGNSPINEAVQQIIRLHEESEKTSKAIQELFDKYDITDITPYKNLLTVFQSADEGAISTEQLLSELENQIKRNTANVCQFTEDEVRNSLEEIQKYFNDIIDDSDAFAKSISKKFSGSFFGPKAAHGKMSEALRDGAFTMLESYMAIKGNDVSSNESLNKIINRDEWNSFLSSGDRKSLMIKMLFGNLSQDDIVSIMKGEFDTIISKLSSSIISGNQLREVDPEQYISLQLQKIKSYVKENITDPDFKLGKYINEALYENFESAEEIIAKIKADYGEINKYSSDEIELTKSGATRLLSDIGLTKEQLLEKIQKENTEIEEGNRLYKERITLLKDGKVIDSFIGEHDKVNAEISKANKTADEILHTHPIDARTVGTVPAAQDLENLFALTNVKNFVMSVGNQLSNLALPNGFDDIKELLPLYREFFNLLGTSLTNGLTQENISDYAESFLKYLVNGGFEKISNYGLGEILDISNIDQNKLNLILEVLYKLDSEGGNLGQMSTTMMAFDNGLEKLLATDLKSNKTPVSTESKNTILQFSPREQAQELQDFRTEAERTKEAFDDLGEEYYESEEYCKGLLEACSSLRTLYSKIDDDTFKDDSSGLSNAHEVINGYLQLYPELKDLVSVLSNSSIDTDKFLDHFDNFLDTLPKAKAFTDVQRNIISNFVDWDEQVHNSDGITYFDKELSDLNTSLQEATNKEENFIVKYKEIVDAMKSGQIDQYDAYRAIIEKEFPDHNVYAVPGGFQLLPKTQKELEEVSEATQNVETKIVQFGQKAEKTVIETAQELSSEVNNLGEDLGDIDDITPIIQSEQKLLPAIIETNTAYQKRNEEFDKARIAEQAFLATIGQTNEDKINRDAIETLKQKREEQEKLNQAKREEVALSSSTAEDVDTKAEESAKAVEKEAEAMTEVKEESEMASTSKKGFAKANAEVLQSIKESLSGLTDEAELFKALNNIINKFSGKGSDERISTLANNIIKIKDALSGSIDDNSFIDALQKLSEQGENLKNLASVLKASKKQIESVKDSIDDSNELSLEDRDALAHQIAQSEEYEREQKRVLEIEKEIEKARKEGQKQAEAYAKQQLDAQNKLKTSIENYTKKLQDAIDADEIAKKTGAGVSRDLVNRWETLKADLGNIDVTADTTKAQEDFVKLKEKIDSALSPKERKYQKVIPEEVITNLGAQIEDFGAKNTRLSKELSERLEEVRRRYHALLNSGSTGDALERELKSISSELNKIKTEANAAGQAGKNFGHMMLDSLKSANARFIANYLSIQDMIRYIRTIATTITEVDSALTELRKVSNATNIRLQQNFEKSAETAKELGSTITDVINQTADWARLGYNVDDAEKLARVTTLFQTVGDNMTAETASEAMISTLKAYGIAVDQSERIVDQYNEVANNFAIDTAGLADSITRAGAALHAGGNALSESMGLVVAANDSLQDPSSVGQMLKTMSMRLRGASVADLEELGIDTTGMSQGTKSIVQQFKAMAGIDIMEGTDYKSTFQILDELHEKWADLTDAEHAALTEAVGGKRGGSVMSSLMENWADAKAVVEQAENSTGSAMREQQNYAQSIQYSIDRTKASLQELQADLINSDSVKVVVEMANSLINAVDKIVTNKTALVAIFSAITSIFAVNKNVGGLKNTSPLLCSDA